jgi:1-acyl-sn-glycerol-3-phosphate acyltransferase
MMIKEKIRDLYYYSWLGLVMQWIVAVIIRIPYLYIFNRVSIRYLGEKPKAGVNYLYVSNHRSLKDPPVLGLSINNPIAFIAKKELFYNPVLAFFMYICSTISVDRQTAESQTFRAAKKALSSKFMSWAWSVGIFIEGTRSTDPGRLGKPNKGPIFIARLTKTQIVPVGISYKNKRDIEIVVGEPYEIDYKADLDDLAWDCLERISKLCDYGMPERN